VVDGKGRSSASTRVAGVGLGLAVPINATTRRIVGALMRARAGSPAYLGLVVATALSRLGSLPSSVGPRESASTKWSRQPAAAAGLRAKDVILDVERRAPRQAGDLQRLMISDAIGRSLTCASFRDDNRCTSELMRHPRGAADTDQRSG